MPYIDLFEGLTGKKEGKTRLMNMVMQVILPHYQILNTRINLSL